VGVKTQVSANASGACGSPSGRRPPPLQQGLHRETISFTVPGENSVQLKDILIGEVWLCGASRT